MDRTTDIAQAKDHGHGPRTITIHIDKKTYKVPAGAITTEQLRALPDPDVPPDRDLYLEAHGHAEDVLMKPGDTVTVEEGMHFFTAPGSITPGCDAA